MSLWNIFHRCLDRIVRYLHSHSLPPCDRFFFPIFPSFEKFLSPRIFWSYVILSGRFKSNTYARKLVPAFPASRIDLLVSLRLRGEKRTRRWIRLATKRKPFRKRQNASSSPFVLATLLDEDLSRIREVFKNRKSFSRERVASLREVELNERRGKRIHPFYKRDNYDKNTNTRIRCNGIYKKQGWKRKYHYNSLFEKSRWKIQVFFSLSIPSLII